MAAFNTSFILAYFLLDLFFFPSPLSKSTYSPTSKLKVPKDRRKAPTESQTPSSKDAPVLLRAINHNGLSVFLLVSKFMTSSGLELTGITGQRVNRLHQSVISHDVHERHVCDGDPEYLFNWYLPVCMGDEGSEAMEAVVKRMIHVERIHNT